MGERNQTQAKTDDGMDDLYDPGLSEFGDDDFDALEDSVLSLRSHSTATSRFKIMRTRRCGATPEHWEMLVGCIHKIGTGQIY